MSNRSIITIRDINWESVVEDVKSKPYIKKQKRKLKISEMPADVFSYQDSRLAEHQILYTVFDIKTGRELFGSKEYRCWWCAVKIAKTQKIPIGAVVRKVGSVYHTDGYFCDWSCLKAGVKRITNASVPLCAELYHNLFQLDWGLLKKAGSWMLLKEFGGGMDRLEWEKIKSSKDKLVPIIGIQLSTVSHLWEITK